MRDVITGTLNLRSRANLFKKFLPLTASVMRTPKYGIRIEIVKGTLNISERKMYRRILGPVYDNEKEYWRLLTNKEIYASVKSLL